MTIIRNMGKAQKLLNRFERKTERFFKDFLKQRTTFYVDQYCKSVGKSFNDLEVLEKLKIAFESKKLAELDLQTAVHTQMRKQSKEKGV